MHDPSPTSDSNANSDTDSEDVRCQITVQTILDVLMRFEETTAGKHSTYDVLSYVMEELVQQGFCAACLQDALQGACDSQSVDLHTHQDSGILH